MLPTKNVTFGPHLNNFLAGSRAGVDPGDKLTQDSIELIRVSGDILVAVSVFLLNVTEFSTN